MEIKEEEHFMKLEIAPVMEVPEDSPAPTTIPMEIEEDGQLASDTDVTEASHTVEIQAEEPTTLSLPPVLEQPSPTVNAKMKKIFLRIAYVGLQEWNDEWIEMHQDRLAILNTASNGRRGEYIVREEIVQRSWQGPPFNTAAQPSSSNDVHQHNDSSLCAYYADYTFTSPGYVLIVNHFCRYHGCRSIFFALDMVNNSNPGGLRVELAHALPLIRVLGTLSNVFSVQMYPVFQNHVLALISRAFLSMTPNDMRSIPVEDIDSTLTAFETLFYRVFDRYTQGHRIERFRMELIWHYLQCPFLNRRLGALKMLIDLIKRTSMKTLFPDGIQRVQTTGDRISYTHVKVTYELTTIQICEHLMNKNILDILYLGADTHDSLIERSGQLLRYLALVDMLTNEQVVSLAKAGLERTKCILKVLPDMTQTLRDEKLSHLIAYMLTVERNLVNDLAVDVVSAVVERYRSKLMHSDHPQKLLDAWVSGHEAAVTVLLTWMKDDAATSPTVATLAMQKLETLMEIGQSHQQALENKLFRWDIQWIRTAPLLHAVLNDLRVNTSVLPSLRVLSAFVYCWPMLYEHELADNVAPCRPQRSAVVQHLIEKHNIFEVLCNAIITAKSTFAQQCEQHSDSQDNYSAQESSNLLGTRATYAQHLELLLDVVHLMYRSIEKKYFPQETIKTIWSELVEQANIAHEFDSTMNFVSKIPTKIVETSSTTTSSSSSSATAAAATTTSAASFFRANEKQYIDFFQTYLCDGKGTGYFRSEYFTMKSFRCLEKWFRWINTEMGTFVGAKDSKIVSVSVDPSELVGVDAFLTVCFEAQSEVVANASVTLITALTRAAKNARGFRQKLVNQTITLLHRVNNETVGGVVQQSLKRPLLLLDGLIEESFLLSPKRLHPHSSLFHGNLATFKISGTSKNTKGFSGEIVMRLNDTVEDLFKAVAKEMKMAWGDLKIFRQGREITPAEFRKTISQMPMSAGEKSALVVAERPVKPIPGPVALPTNEGSVPISREISAENGNASSGEVNGTSMDSDAGEMAPVALSIATTMETFKCFFDLLSKSEREDIDSLWRTVSQLPTSWHSVAAWTLLDCQHVKDLAFPLEASNVHRLSELIYNLQVIEILLYPLITVTDLVNQYGISHQDALLNSETSQSWCLKFVEKGGIDFLCQCYEWITMTIVAYNHKDNNGTLTTGQESSHAEASHTSVTTPGINISLLLLGARISVKLLKGFQARSQAQDVTNGAAHTFLEDFLWRYHKKKVLNLHIASFSAEMNYNLRLQQIREKLLLADGGEGMNTTDHHYMKLSVDPQQIISTPRMYWSTILRYQAIMDIELQGKLDPPSTASNKASVTGAWDIAKTLESQEKRMLLASMQDLLFMWTSISLSNPTVLEEHSYNFGSQHNDSGDTKGVSISFETFFRTAAFSRRSTKEKAESELFDHPSVIDWFPQAFMEFIGWTLGKAAAKVLLSHAIETMVKIRPSIVPALQTTTGVLLTPTATVADAPEYEQYFGLFGKLLQLAVDTSLPVPATRAICDDILHELHETVKHFQVINASSTSSTASAHTALNLTGNLQIFASMVSMDSTILQNFGASRSRETVEFLIEDILGLSISRDGGDNPNHQDGSSAHRLIVLSSESRQHVYAILNAFCQVAPALAMRIYEICNRIHRTFQPPTNDNWDVLPERQSRSALGFVGLKNFGATCYMNSLLQVLYSSLNVRNYILHQLSFDYVPADERRNHMLLQLQTVFAHLRYSEKKSYAPADWTFAFKDETGVNPLNTLQQQDAQEFLQLLFERFETGMDTHIRHLKATSTNALADEDLPQDILKSTFGGKFCNLMYVLPSATNHAGGNEQAIARSIQEHGIRVPEESFVCVSVDVGSPNLETSLAKLVQGETISDFTWKDGQPKCEIVRKQCFAELSDSIIFHLKRFKLNFDTFSREKINEAFHFPLTLNMKSYMHEGQDEYRYEAHDGPTHAQIAERTDEYYQYELAGVVVHTGTADSGHYYAYLRDNSSGSGTSNGVTNADATWMEFNDSEISKFVTSRLESECFGGVSAVHEYLPTTQSMITSEVVNSKNAYMLVYNRVTPLKAAVPRSPNPVYAQEKSQLVQHLKESIAVENAQHRLACRILLKDHLSFFTKVVRILFETSTSSSNYDRGSVAIPPVDVLLDTIRFFLQYALRTPHSTECQLLAHEIATWFEAQSQPPSAATNSAMDVVDSQAVVDEADKENSRPVGSVGKVIQVSKETLSEQTDDETKREALARVDTLKDELEMEVVGVDLSTPASQPVSTAVGVVDSADDEENRSVTLPPPPPNDTDTDLSSFSSSSLVLLPPPPPSAAEENASNRQTPAQSCSDVHGLLPPPPPPVTPPSSATDASGNGNGKPNEDSDVIVNETETSAAVATAPTLAPASSSEEVAQRAPPTPFSPLWPQKQSPNALPISAVVIQELFCNDSEMLFANFFAPNQQYRELTNRVVFSVFAHAWQAEQDDLIAWFATDPIITLGVLDKLMVEFTTNNGVHGTHHQGMNNVMDIDGIDEDPELLLALQLSTADSTAPASKASTTLSTEDNLKSNGQFTGTISTATTVASDYPCSTMRFLVEVTQNNRVQWVPDQWRKSAAYVQFLLNVLNLGGATAANILVKRDLVAQCVDIILGESSPLFGKVYPASAMSRKHAPSSYLAVLPAKDAKSLSLSARSIPDWSILLELLVGLVEHSSLSVEAREYYTNKRRKGMVPRRSPMLFDVLLSEYDYECITSKTLYTTLIKQARYRHCLARLVRVLSVQNQQFTHLVYEVLWEEMTLSSAESLVSIFEVLEAFLSVEDEHQRQRAHRLLSWNTRGSLVEYVLALAFQPGKGNLVVAFVRSFVGLLQKLPWLLDIVANPIDNVTHWAKPMVQVCNMHRSRDQHATTTSTISIGPYVVVYGEEEGERELTWALRADRAFEVLSTLLFEWGIDPMQWITVPAHSVAATASNAMVVVGSDVASSSSSVPVVTGHAITSSTLPVANAVVTNNNNHNNKATTTTTTATSTHDVTSTQVVHLEDTQNDFPFLTDGMTDEEFEMALAKGGFS